MNPILHLHATGLASALVVGLLLPALSQAQSASASEGVETAQSDDVGVVARYRERYEALKEKGVSFSLGSLLPGSSLTGGVALERERLFGTFLGASADAGWSVRGYHRYDVRFGRIKGREHRVELGPADADITSVFNDNSLLAFGTSIFVEWRQRVYPRVDFFGLGQGSTLAGRSDFGIEGSSLDLVLQWQRNAHFGVSGRVGTLGLSLTAGRNRAVENTDVLYSQREAPGLTSQPRYLMSGAAATIDFRDRPRLTTMGTFASVGVWHATPRRGSTGTPWTRLIVEVRDFRPLHGEVHVLALHAFVTGRVGDQSVATPFYLQPTIGGSKTLRGFGSYRLRGDALWTATAEYRWRAHRWIEIAPFVDVGAVATSFDTLNSVTPDATPGIGLRVLSSSRVMGRIDLARGRDGARMVLTLSTPF